MSPAYADLANLPEATRIAVIRSYLAAGKTVAFIVDNDEKADRYLRQLEDTGAQILDRGPGPVRSTIFVKLGPRLQ